ncbi:MAG: glycosyltransferase family 4 protein [Gammaproteobacteria bacterium]
MKNGRLSICYAAPGHTLVASAGSTRNILAVAEALGEQADVTVAFRTVSDEIAAASFAVTEIERTNAVDARRRDDVAARGLNPLSHLVYCRTLNRFAATTAHEFDLVFEKGWRLSGYLALAFGRHGVPAILIENDARHWNEPVATLRQLAKYLAHLSAQRVAAYCSRRTPLIIAETAQLKTALVEQRHVAAERIEVVHLGVDHALFRPMDQARARAALGLSPNKILLIYVGGLDQYHDLSPMFLALCDGTIADLEILVVGDGEYRQRYESLAQKSAAAVRFIGKIGHERIPEYVAAADACLAPYHTKGFYKGEVSFSTLKIPEYMACARPVISVPSGHIRTLIENATTGILFDNGPREWRQFFESFPTREKLAEMGSRAAAKVASMSWRATARAYYEFGSRLRDAASRPQVA